MSITDYVIDILLVLFIFRQVRPHELTLRTLVLPLTLIVVAGFVYLRPVTLTGDDLALVVLLALTGAVLGLFSGLADKTWHDRRGRLLYRAEMMSVLTWITGMGFRFGFAYYADHSGAGAVARFSASHHITSAGVWTTALVVMAFGQVPARLAVLQVRRERGGRLVPVGPLALGHSAR